MSSLMSRTEFTIVVIQGYQISNPKGKAKALIQGYQFSTANQSITSTILQDFCRVNVTMSQAWYFRAERNQEKRQGLTGHCVAVHAEEKGRRWTWSIGR